MDFSSTGWSAIASILFDRLTKFGLLTYCTVMMISVGVIGCKITIRSIDVIRSKWYE